MLAMIFELLDRQGKDQSATAETFIAAYILRRSTWRGLCQIPLQAHCRLSWVHRQLLARISSKVASVWRIVHSRLVMPKGAKAFRTSVSFPFMTRKVFPSRVTGRFACFNSAKASRHLFVWTMMEECPRRTSSKVPSACVRPCERIRQRSHCDASLI